MLRMLQIMRCDGILEHMESLLGRFQSDLGQVSDEIRTLQVKYKYSTHQRRVVGHCAL